MLFNNNPWIKQPVPNPDASTRLFCFSYAGGSASVFRQWPDYLSKDIEMCAVQLPGREGRFAEKPFMKLSDLIDTLVEELIPYLDRPFTFYGHSMGTLIAFELARKLRRLGRQGPEHIFVSGRCAPQVEDPEVPLHQLPDKEFIEGLRRYNGTPEAVFNDKDIMELLVPLIRADFTVCETYNYYHEEPLDCPISAFAGEDEISSKFLDDWKEQTRHDFDTGIFPGDHFFINTHQKQFVGAISDRIENGRIYETYIEV